MPEYTQMAAQGNIVLDSTAHTILLNAVFYCEASGIIPQSLLRSKYEYN
jgi:hypothetical protein